MDVNNLMELKESILKAEKENEEKLNKEGVKQFPMNTFGLDDAKIVCTNKSIDDNINMKAPPDPFVFIKMVILCYVAPCAAFAKYIKSYPVVGTVETTLEKKKGFTTRFKTTDDINEKLSASFKGWK
ncbi:hypothetical protein ACTFIT_011545 [Dictyostelium discoideum]